MSGSKIIHALLQNSRRSSLSSSDLYAGRISSSSPSVAGRFFNTRSVHDQHDRATNNVEIGSETKVNALKTSQTEYGCPSKDMPIQICSVEDAESGNISKNALRPLSPHLSIYKPQKTSMYSISHRFAGAFVATAIPLFYYTYDIYI